ncbi:response regulator [Pseudonocardia aurantiaca]|uniref:Response regulator n=1 Tax=Pseudonocardia aurantiaca TaxID=75290 RepID=A0ABW4FWJ0_9PSEU
MVSRCLIVDDNQRFLDVACWCLEREGIEVLATATTIAEAMQKAAEHNPDFVLVDIALGAESGFELTRRLVAMFPELRSRIVLISTRVKEDFDDLVQTSPAAGFLSKSMLSAAGIHELLSGGQK